MRKFAVATFAVLYGIMVVSAAVERTNDWAAREAPVFGHFVSSPHFPCFGKIDKAETHLRYQKIVERGFVVESPRKGVGAPTFSIRHTLRTCSEYQATRTAHTDSPRAPPFEI